MSCWFVPSLVGCTLSAWLWCAGAHAQTVDLPAVPEPIIAPEHKQEPYEQAPAPPSPPPTRNDDWAFSITPYLWLASVSNGLGDSTLNTNVGQLAKLLNGAFMVNTQAQYRDFGLVVDYMFVALDTTKELGAGSLGLDAREHVLDMRASYRVLDTRPGHRKGAPGSQLFVDMGARYWRLKTSVDASLPPVLPNGQGIDREIDGEQSWADWIVGARILSDVTSRVGLGLAANLGGFNIASSSKFTWEVTTGVRFTVWRHLQLDVGYRALQAIRDGHDVRGNVRTTKVTMSGVLLGVGAAF